MLFFDTLKCLNSCERLRCPLFDSDFSVEIHFTEVVLIKLLTLLIIEFWNIWIIILWVSRLQLVWTDFSVASLNHNLIRVQLMQVLEFLVVHPILQIRVVVNLLVHIRYISPHFLTSLELLQKLEAFLFVDTLILVFHLLSDSIQDSVYDFYRQRSMEILVNVTLLIFLLSRVASLLAALAEWGAHWSRPVIVRFVLRDE